MLLIPMDHLTHRPNQKHEVGRSRRTRRSKSGGGVVNCGSGAMARVGRLVVSRERYWAGMMNVAYRIDGVWRLRKKSELIKILCNPLTHREKSDVGERDLCAA